jgi:hypothetical protein
MACWPPEALGYFSVLRHASCRSGPSKRARCSPPLKIEQYNGGLFAHDDLLDRRKVPDEVCKGLDRLAAYEYRPPALDDEIAAGKAPKFIDVEILGHIFEQSISDLEHVH